MHILQSECKMVTSEVDKTLRRCYCISLPPFYFKEILLTIHSKKMDSHPGRIPLQVAGQASSNSSHVRNKLRLGVIFLKEEHFFSANRYYFALQVSPFFHFLEW